MMWAIEFNTIGKIVAGDDVGNYIKVIPDLEVTGGYFILLSSNPNLTNAFDDWVENKEDLTNYFRESSWVISWENKNPAGGS